MNGISFFVHGIPHRHVRRVVRNKSGGKEGTYETDKSQSWREIVYIQSVQHRPAQPSELPIAIALEFYLPRPKSLPKKVKAHIKRPDAENLLKHTIDAMAGVMWRDDSQIIRLVVTKQYSDIPGLHISIQEVDL